jgi:anthranilate synthase component 1
VTVFGDTDNLAVNTPKVRFQRIPYDSPASIFFKLAPEYEYAFLLESRTGLGNTALCFYIGFDPTATVRVKDCIAIVNEREEHVQDPLDAVQGLISGKRHTQHRYGFLGGAVGYVSYDAIRYWERIPNTAVDDLDLPDIEMGIYDDGIVLDHLRGEAFYFHIGKNRYEELCALFQRPCALNVENRLKEHRPVSDASKALLQVKKTFFSNDKDVHP